MKVTFVLIGYWRHAGGGARVVYQHANGLAARGHDVTVVHARTMPPDGQQSVPARAKQRVSALLERLKGPPERVSWQPTVPGVRRVYVPTLDAEHVPDGDAVFATAWRTVDLVLSYPEEKGEKFYLVQGYETWDGAKDRVDATWRAPLRKVVVSDWLANVARDLGVQDVVHVPNAVAHETFRVTRPIEERPPRVAMLYSPHPWKGSLDGLEALRIAKERVPHMEAVLFGVGRRPRGLPAWITYERHAVEDTLVHDVYNASSVYLCPSLTEGWGLPPAEAMACGCALVSTDNGGVHDFAVHEENALLSPPGDPEALAENLVRVLRDASLRYDLANAGVRAIRRFTWERSVTMLEAFLQENASRMTQASGTSPRGP